MSTRGISVSYEAIVSLGKAIAASAESLQLLRNEFSGMLAKLQANCSHDEITYCEYSPFEYSTTSSYLCRRCKLNTSVTYSPGGSSGDGLPLSALQSKTTVSSSLFTECLKW